MKADPLTQKSYSDKEQPMDEHQQPKKLPPQVSLIIIGGVGLLFSIAATTQLFLPTLGTLPQFSSFSPLARLVVIIKLLSPLLSFLLAGGWVWLLLQLSAWWLSLQRDRTPKDRRIFFQRQSTQNIRAAQKHQKRALPKDHAPNDVLGTVSQQAKRVTPPPALFQLDPTIPRSATELPLMPPLFMANTTSFPRVEQEEQTNDDQADEKERRATAQAEQTSPSQALDASSPHQQADESLLVSPASAHFSLQKPADRSETRTVVTLTLLKQIKAWMQADDGTAQEVKLRGGENAIRLIQLAYIAWRQGAPVDKDKMLTYVLSRGKRRDMNTEQLGEVFDAAKRYLRQDLDRAVNELEKNGHPISQDVDFFSNEPGFYWLHPCCRIVDLEKIEGYYHTIQIARKEGLLNEKLNGSLPGWVLQACRDLIAAYPGDFLQSLLEKFPEEFGPWVKEPVTFYRDRYLDALLILANAESARSRTFFDQNLSLEQNEEQRRTHSGKAAQLFYDYAMYALNSRWDQKVKFAYRAGKDGERVVRAARAMRRCVVELGKVGNPDMIDQVYLAFKERMSILSEGNWKPDKETESDVAEAKRTTNAYRFSSQIALHQNGNSNK